jgi:hypothetical protein
MCLLTHNSILNLLPQTSQPNGITAKWSALTVIQHVYPHIQLGKDFLSTDVTAKRSTLTVSEHVFLEIFSSPRLFVAHSALMRSESKNSDSTAEEDNTKKKVNKSEKANNVDAIEDKKTEKIEESETVVTPKTPNVYDGPENEIQF